jgi:hypothetical protein
MITASVAVQSDDQVALLTLPQGIKATGTTGQPLPEVSIHPAVAGTVPAPEPGSSYTYSGVAYQLNPDGARFSPAIPLTLTLSQDQLTTLTANNREPVIRVYMASDKSWVTLPTTFNAAARTVSTPISHFCTYAVFSQPMSASVANPAPITTTQPVSTLNPAPVAVQQASASNPAPVATSPAAAKAPPAANAFEIMIGLASWGIGLMINNLLLTILCVVLVSIGYVGWMRYRRKKRYDFLMYGRR